MTHLSALLSQIDSGSLVLPEFQRGYVWSRDQVRGLLRSLYLHYPVGGLLVWETQAAASDVRNAEIREPSTRTLLLDGQQRITSLYGVIRGHAPEFFEGDDKTFLGLYFNVEDEVFEFFAPVKMKDDPRWVNVTRLFVEGLEPFIELFSNSQWSANLSLYVTRLARLRGIVDREFHLEKIVGSDKTTDVVVDIFNRVNSGGTKLSKGDLALAKVAAQSPELRQRMRQELARWSRAGYEFNLDWLLRNVTAVATGKAPFASLDAVLTKDFELALKSAVSHIDSVLNILADRLGLDHGRVLISRYAIPVLVRYLHVNGGKFPTALERDKALYWYVHAGMWGRFSGSTETVLAQDYESLAAKGLEGVIENLAKSRGGSLFVTPADFAGYGMGSRFYPLLYLLTRVNSAQDFGDGTALKMSLLGKLSSLQVHHIFPKRVLYDAGYSRSEVNAVANFVFLTQKTNLEIGKTPPREYLPEVRKKHSGALESQWIPVNPRIWHIERYSDFLAERRELLAAAANEFLGSLLVGSVIDDAPLPRGHVVTDEDLDARGQQIDELLAELAQYAVVAPERDIEVSDPESGACLAVAEAYWAEGLQPGRGEPTVLELDPTAASVERLQELGFRVFTSVEALRAFVLREAAIDAGESADG